jgi:hypothetical protein
MEVGSKVFCVDGTRKRGSEFFEQFVEEGEVYTIRTKVYDGLSGKYRLLLDEVKNPSVYVTELMGSVEPGFDSKRFVPYEDYILGNYVAQEEDVEATV